VAKLTSKRRANLKPSQFAVPSKDGYPIPDAAHARNALARVAQHGSPSEQARVKAAVRKKFPGINVGGKSKK
jgi:hypothetical protein